MSRVRLAPEGFPAFNFAPFFLVTFRVRRGRDIFFGLFLSGALGEVKDGWNFLRWCGKRILALANCGAETGSNIEGRVPSRTVGDMNGLGENQADADN
jgi:hypothetical protein